MIRIGIVGLGSVAQEIYLPALAQLEDNKIVAVCDIDPARAHRTAEKLQTRAYTEPVKMIEQQCPDGVLVLTPPFVHHDGVTLALRTDCHVLCEMPPALDRDEAARMVDYAREKEVNIAFALRYRHAPAFLKLRELSNRHLRGTLCITLTESRGAPDAETVRTFGHPLLRPAMRALDTAIWLKGPAGDVRFERTADLVATMGIRHENNSETLIHLNFQANQSLERYLIQDEGLSAEVACDKVCHFQALTATGVERDSGVEPVESLGYLGLVAAFLKCSDKGKPPPHAAEDTLAVMDIAQRLIQQATP